MIYFVRSTQDNPHPKEPSMNTRTKKPSTQKTSKKSSPSKASMKTTASDSPSDETQETEIVEFARNVLNPQIILSQKENNEAFEDRLLSYFSLGYLYKVSVGVASHHKVRGPKKKEALARKVFVRLFGEAGEEIFQEVMKIKDHNDFKKGGALGVQELKETLEEKDSAMGLCRFLMEVEPN